MASKSGVKRKLKENSGKISKKVKTEKVYECEEAIKKVGFLLNFYLGRY